MADLIDRKVMRFMGDAAAYAYLSMQQAIADAKLTEEMVSNPRTGLVAGSGGASSKNQIEVVTLYVKGVRRVGHTWCLGLCLLLLSLSGNAVQNQRHQLFD